VAITAFLLLNRWLVKISGAAAAPHRSP
jgi:hypothetical protein